ncbi:host cell division inhibitor Icd-like protein [Enterobacter hormaechei]|uniref:host cell division inhibitor Icd-like protein n=2 Tax=Enterobacter TaxID=547 RepID=UPI0035241C3B
MTIKGLKCDSLECSFKSTGAIHLESAKPGSVPPLTGSLTKPLSEVTVMAENQSTQTRPEFTWRFISASERYPTAKPLVIYVNASSEQEARNTMPGVNLIFAARLPFHAFQVMEVRHA